MFISHFLRDIKVTLANAYRNHDWMRLWDVVLIPVGLPLLLGVSLGILLAILIIGEYWALIFGMLLLIPAAILFLSYPFAAILLWLLLMPFLQTTTTTQFRMVYWFIHRAMPACVLIIIVLSNMLRINKHRQVVRLGRAELAMALFLGIGIVNILFFHSNPVSYLVLFYDRVFVPMFLYLIIRLTAPGEKDLERLLPVALVIVFVETIVTILSFISPSMLPAEWLRLQGARGTGTFDNPYTYSMCLVFFSFLLFHAANQCKPGLRRTVYMFSFGMGVLGIFLAFSRATWLGALIASLGLLILYPKTAIRIMTVIIIIMIVLGLGILSEQVEWAVARLGQDDSAYDRWVIWDAGLQMISSKPLIGWGYGDYSIYAGQFQRRILNYVSAYAHSSHNVFLTVGAEMGLPALLVFLFPLMWWLRRSFKVWPRSPKAGLWSLSLLVILWLSLIDQITITMFTDTRHSTYALGLWWITLGLIGNMAEVHLQPDDTKPPESIIHYGSKMGVKK